jgi:hypothetical protein
MVPRCDKGQRMKKRKLIAVPESFHRRLKTKAASQGLKIKEFIMRGFPDLVDDEVEKRDDKIRPKW